MRGCNNMYRLRFGKDAYRIVYRTDSENRRIIVRAVGPRATVYRVGFSRGNVIIIAARASDDDTRTR
jgi:hypothetical protein